MASPIEQIKEKLDLVELIQSYVRLQKAGVNYKAVCPFHKEKTPSFVVSPARQIWHCFGCSRGGDHFKFIMEHEGVEFPEALHILAKMTGVQLRREDEKARSERMKILEILEKAKDFYKKNLEARKDVFDYLFERGLKKETIADFELGYAPAAWENAHQHLKGLGYSSEDIEKTGLLIRKENSSSFYDRFRSRIMFPIHDSTGSVIGFSGRIFEKDLPPAESREPQAVPAKYINTPNTLIYDKSRVLYGWHRAKNEVRRRNACVIVEGQMDLLLAHQAGTQNGVAISGTALTDWHLAKIKRLTQNIIFALDPDNAGLLATKRGLDAALRYGFEIKIINLKNEDPADLIKKDAGRWLELVKSAKPVIGYYLDFLNSRLKDERELVLAVWRVVIPYLAFVQNILDQGYWVKETAKIIKMKEEPVWEAIQKEKSKIQNPKSKTEILAENDDKFFNSKFRSRRDLLEERLIGLICWKSELGEVCETNWGEYFSASRRPIFLKSLSVGGVQDEHYPKKLALEAELYYTHQSDFREELKKLFSELKKEHLKSEMNGISQKISEAEKAGDKEVLEEFLREFNRVAKELNIGSQS